MIERYCDELSPYECTLMVGERLDASPLLLAGNMEPEAQGKLTSTPGNPFRIRSSIRTENCSMA
jgi:hypothetical protein